MLEWHEELPECCPPDNAISSDRKLYRLCDCNPPKEADFLSLRKLFPTKPFNATECIARAVSVWEQKEKCLNLKKLPAHKNKIIIELNLKNSDGVIFKTGQPYHYSWWRTKNFNINDYEIIDS